MMTMKMSFILLLVGLLFTIGILYFIWLVNKIRRLQKINQPVRPAIEYLPKLPKENDKIVVVENVDEAEINAVLFGFCNLYNAEKYQALPRLFKISENEFVITFPYDIDFEFFCYFINYVAYPLELKRKLNVVGWTTAKKEDSWVPENCRNKKVMLFLSADDKEGDNVFLTTFDNAGCKIGFGMREEKQQLDKPNRNFRSPKVFVLEEKTFVDFK
jgi:hypothetical protein